MKPYRRLPAESFELAMLRRRSDRDARTIADLRAQLATQTRRADVAEQAARTDKLTGLPNRLALEEAIEGENLSIKDGPSVGAALIFIDLNKFKQINDIYGHETGDRALKAVSELKKLKNIIRETDMLARLGGDEFVILLTNITPDHADAKRQVISQALETGLFTMHPLTRTQTEIVSLFVPVRGSCGMAFLDGDTPAEIVLARSDAAMYQQKQQNRPAAAA